jgi:FlaA1/EpsC-like NDP-sugar epimerase
MNLSIIRPRRPLILLVNLALAALSNYCAFLLRFDGVMPPVHVAPFLRVLPLLLVLRLISFRAFRLDEGLWRYTSLWDLRNIIAAATTSSAVFGLIVWAFLDVGPYPRFIYLIDTILLIGLLGGARLLRRTYWEFDRFHTERRVLIFGAGDAGELIVRDMKNNRYYDCDPIGFIDDDVKKVGRSIHGVRVLGTRADLARIIDNRRPDEVVIAIPRARPAEMRSILKALEPFKVSIKTLPNLRDVLEGKSAVSQVRSLSLEDLMPRKPVGLDSEDVRRFVNGRRVLVTGAGGSIGAELSRQLAGLGPAKLVLVERYENALFELCNNLDRLHPGCSYEPVIADITDAGRIDRIFRNTRPDAVFHAAAHKHVPLVELNPSEAVKNNVRGTRMLAEASLRHRVGEFVLISSDKAVNPSSVMGATKRVAELIVRSLDHVGPTRFVAVRFGNVLGSNGSVSRLFADQIARGGPVTITHPEMRRYFMLIPEAVLLVLHAAAMHDTDTIYALDMGEPISVLDLARNMIRLSGFVPDDEIAISIVGLRPGEKLFEEIVEEGEHTEPSDVAKVLRVHSKPIPDGFVLTLAELERAAEEERDADALSLIAQLVPTFRTPAYAAEPPVRMIRAVSS